MGWRYEMKTPNIKIKVIRPEINSLEDLDKIIEHEIRERTGMIYSPENETLVKAIVNDYIEYAKYLDLIKSNFIPLIIYTQYGIRIC